MMDDERLHLEQWDRLTSAERGEVAREVAGRLPAPFRLLGLEWHALGDQRHEVAFFDWHGARFALIPGGAVTLGYDRDHPFVPNAAQMASWEVELAQRADWLEAGYLDHQLGSVDEFLDLILSPLQYLRQI